MATDTSLVKEKIINTLSRVGPSLPVHIAKSIGMDMLFTSAFLSELLSEKKILSTHMKVGTSKIFYLKGQEEKLERYFEHIKGKEKEALDMLKEKKFLEDDKLEPSIKVALRELKDFAKEMYVDEKIIWRYFLTLEEEYKKEETKVKEEVLIKKEIEQGETSEEKPTPKKKTKKRTKKKRTGSGKSAKEKANERFFNKVKEFLNEKGIEITDIHGFTKKDLTLKVKENDKESLLIAFNKKRVTETDIVNAYKKANDEGLKFKIFSLGEPAKKTQNIIDASKNLDSIEKIE